MGSQEIRERWSLTSLQVQKRSFVLAVGAEERWEHSKQEWISLKSNSRRELVSHFELEASKCCSQHMSSAFSSAVVAVATVARGDKWVLSSAGKGGRSRSWSGTEGAELAGQGHPLEITWALRVAVVLERWGSIKWQRLLGGVEVSFYSLMVTETLLSFLRNDHQT